MEEKTIIKGTFAKNNSVFICSLSLSLLSLLIIFVKHLEVGLSRDFLDFLACGFLLDGYVGAYGIFFYLLPLLLLFTFITYFWFGKCELTVTDKRVFGKAAFGKRVDLPIDKISSVAGGWLKTIAIATSSGKIKFYLCNNREDVFAAVTNILLERQESAKSEQKNQPVVQQTVVQSDADELKKFKDFLDSGVITQEEFDAKKKQILGL